MEYKITYERVPYIRPDESLKKPMVVGSKDIYTLSVRPQKYHPWREVANFDLADDAERHMEYLIEKGNVKKEFDDQKKVSYYDHEGNLVKEERG